MNWILILVLLVLVLSIMNGYRRGFLRIVYSLVSWVIVLVFVTWSSPYINTYLIEHTGIYEKIEQHCLEALKENAQSQIEEKAGDEAGNLAELGVNLPDAVLNNILEKSGSVADEFMESTGIYEQLAKGLAGFVVEGIAFFIALLCASIIVQMISHLLGIVSRIPIIKGVNRYMGLFAGAIYGLMIVWIAFYIIALCSTSEWGMVLTSYIYQSRFLTYLYKNNIVLTLLLYLL